MIEEKEYGGNLGGRFVSNRGELNYKEVLEHFPNASIIRIITYNISRNQRQDKLFEALRDTDAEIQLITNVPSRMEEYFDNEAGRSMRKTARRNIQIYIAKLNPENFSGNFLPYFNVHNHAKIIGTEDIVYIGSANFSNESADNIETGILIEDRDFISKLYSEFFDKVASESLSYLDDNFNAFHLFLLSLYAKFEHHYNILLRDVYTDYQRTRLVAADTIFIDTDELGNIYRDLEELEDVSSAAEDCYDEENEQFNSELEDLKDEFESLDIEGLKETVSEDGALYNLATFDGHDKFDEIMQSKYAYLAIDDMTDYYSEKALQEVSEMYDDVHRTFFDQGDEFLEGMDYILKALKVAIDFTERWKASRINPDIDNT